MAREREHKAPRRPGKRTSRWWFVLVVIVGLGLGFVAGYYVHHYWPKAKPAPAPSAPQKTTGQVSAKDTGTAGKGVTAQNFSKPQAFDAAKVSQTMSFLSSNIGARVAGRSGEKQAAAYLRSEMEKLGYEVTVQNFPLGSGDSSENLVASDPGTSKGYTFVVGAHMDTRYANAGANDDASGCAAVLELARVMKNTRHVPEVRFVFFGAEEENSATGEARNGSRQFVGLLGPSERAGMVGMASLDMVSVGPEVHFRSWGRNSPGLADRLAAVATAKGMNAVRDENGQSDHEPFGDPGMPAVWVERMLPGGKNDNQMHTSGDTMSRVMPNLVVEVGDLMRGYLVGLDEGTCKALTTR